MVTDRLTDGVRIAQLLASEVTGDESRLRGLTVVDADPDVEATADGAPAYRIVRETPESGGDAGNADDAADADKASDPPRETVAEVFVQPDRARIEAVTAPETVAAAATEADLRVRPKAVRPPRTLVFVEDGAQVKRALTVLETIRADPDAE